MPDLTYPERVYADPELAFARRIADLGGWMTVSALAENEDAAAADWRRDGRLVEETSGQLEPRRIIRLTVAGWAWCRENGAV